LITLSNLCLFSYRTVVPLNPIVISPLSLENLSLNCYHLSYKIKVKCFRCDNAGENKSFQSLLKKKWKHYIKFEYTAPNTPQQNGKIEHKFATLYGMIQSVLDASGFIALLRSRLWSYAAKCVTQLENTIVDSSTMTASEKFTGSSPKWFKNVHTFGEIGITYNNQKIKGKLDYRGYPCMFIGYTENHASNVYVLFNLNNQAISMSRTSINPHHTKIIV
jgi:hypothetical protein